MTIHTAFQSVYKSLVGISLVVILVACGGGGSSGPKAPTPDTSPEPFTIAAVTNAAVKTDVASSAVTVSGINQAVAISITGGTYSIGGAAYTDAAGTVTNGQAVTVKATSSDKTNTAVTATLTIGGVSGQFKVTTLTDVTPDTFAFTAVKDVAPKSVNTSTAITVAGVDIAVPISITNGEYSINDGTYTSTAGTVSNGQKVTVRATASDKVSTDVIVVLTIGGVIANYKVTTYADTAAPTAQILFPPPVSMTEGNTILVRGSANDDSAIVSVKVNSVLATTTDGYKNWQALVPLPLTGTENDLYVITEDAVGNKSTSAAHVVIRQAPLISAFPDANGYIEPYGLALDQLDGRNRLLVASNSKDIYSVDLTTGKRTLAYTLSDCSTLTITINPLNKHAYAPCHYASKIVDIDLSSLSQSQAHVLPNFIDQYAVKADLDTSSSLLYVKDDAAKIIINYIDYTSSRVELFSADSSLTQFKIISSAEKSIPDVVNPIQESYGIALDKTADRFLVTDYMQQNIFSVNPTTGARSIFSSNKKGTGELFAEVNKGFLSGIAVDEVNQRALVVEYYYNTKIFSIDLATGNRSLLTSTSESNPFNSMYSSSDLKIADPKGYAFVANWGDNAVFAVDLVTGHRVVFSKSVSVTH